MPWLQSKEEVLVLTILGPRRPRPCEDFNNAELADKFLGKDTVPVC